MTSIGSRVSGPLGFQTGNKDVQAVNRSDDVVTVGMVVEFDLDNATDAANNIFGDALSGFATIKDGVSGDRQHIPFGIVMSGGAVGATVTVRLQGRAPAKCSAAVAKGDPLTSSAGAANQLVPAVQDFKIMAVALEDTAAAGLADVLFDGVYGVGHKSSA